MEISPSILDAKNADLKEIEKYCERIHIDVVPNGRITPSFVKKMKTCLIKDVHLMVNPEKNISAYAKYADIINFHVEAGNTLELIRKARSEGVKVGLSINPETKVSELFPFINKIDEVLLMSVHPGKGGQKFIGVSSKIRKIRRMNKKVVIKVDGGIKKRTLRRIKKADIAVMGTYLFHNKNPIGALRELSVENVAKELRKDVIRMVNSAGSGHVGGALGMADIFAVLFLETIKKEDHFVLSNGHICPILYASMARTGVFPREELMTLRKLGSRLQGHPHRESLPGLETTSGPLGMGLSQAAGMALALKADKKKGKVYCVLSDGEHDEGNTWEAVMFASKYKLNNLTCIMDRNRIQLSGNTEDVMPLDGLRKKYKAFGWKVKEINGHSTKKIRKALSINAKKPLMIIANTIPGKGVSFMENKWEWHGKAPNDVEAILALEELK